MPNEPKQEKIKYIILTAGVSKETMGKMRNAITEAVNNKYDKLYFLISSGGGDVVEGLSVAALIRSLSVETIMHNIGQVDSVATVLFASAKTRYANKNSSFLFHGVAMNFEKAHFNEYQLFEQYKIAKRLGEDIARNFSSYTGVPFKTIQGFMTTRAKILTAEQAKTRGIIHDVRDAQIPQGVEIVSIGNI